jgi:hypothetical protein
MRSLFRSLLLAMLATPLALPAQESQVPPAVPQSTPVPAQPIAPPSQNPMPMPEPAAPAVAPKVQAAAPTAPVAPAAHQSPAPRRQKTKAPTRPVAPAVATPTAPMGAGLVNGAMVTPPAQAAFVSLSNIRIIRTQSFDNSNVNAPRLRGTLGPDSRQELSQPGTVFEFKVRPAVGWGIISVDDAKLVRVVTQSGKALATQPVPAAAGASASGGSGMAGWVLPVDLSPEETILQIRTDLPPRADAQLNQLRAEFALTIGYRQTSRVMDLSKRIGQPLEIGQHDVSLVVDSIGPDLIELSASGQFSKIGRITIVDLNGEKIEPYTTEMKTLNQNNVPVKKTWALSFTQLPSIVGLAVDIYPVQTKIQPSYEWQNVSLP